MGLVTESFVANGTVKTFTVSNDVLSGSHCRVHFNYSSVDHAIEDREWDLIGKSTIVFVEAPTSGYIVKITTSSDGSGLDTAPSYISDVINNLSNILIVANISDDITTVSGISGNVTAVSTNNANVTTTATNIGSVNVVANAIQTGTPIGGGSGGQYHGNGIIKGVEYFAQVGVTTDDIVIASGTNAMSVDSFTIANGGSVTIQDNAVYKVI